MEIAFVPKYSFIPLSEGAYSELCNENIQNLFQKWGLEFQIQHFLFNQPLHQYHSYHLAEAFIKDRIVSKNLKTWMNKSFAVGALVASHIDMNKIPCSITSMSFFDKLKDPKNNVTNHSGSLCQRFDVQIDGILVADNLRAMILDQECDEYSLYSKEERNEFIFRIFRMLVLGGEYCQYEDDLKSYLAATKILYRELVRIRKHADNNASISTTVFQLVAKMDNPHSPKDSDHIRNIGFLLVDGRSRKITSFLHQSPKSISEL